MHDTEDREYWWQHGEQLEEQFVEICNSRLGLAAMINPMKQYDKTAPDLVVDGRLADLKAQHTPFFSATRYALNPRYTVTFNRKDYEYYSRCYPGIDIYFWIDWINNTYNGTEIRYYSGIFLAPFEQIAQLIAKGAPEHHYTRRTTDGSGNAKSSFLLHLLRFKPLVTSDAKER